MKSAFLGLVVLHGLIHFMGPAKAFGLAELPQLSQPISRHVGIAWLVAGLAFLGIAAQLVWAPRWWWVTALPAVALSQGVILTAWSDAKFGTLANVVVLAAALYGMASQGPWSFRSAYETQVERRSDDPPSSMPVLTEGDLADLPDPIARYVRASGALGRPRPWRLHARWTGRIRGSLDEEWMSFSAEQHNFLLEPSRFFLMDARRARLPVDVYHDFEDGRARMRVRLLSLLPLVNARGPEMDRAETVTLFNDVALLAPGGLVDQRIEWEAIDARTARGTFTLGSHAVSAVLHVSDEGDLVDFVSDDRLAASADGESFEPRRWSTPVSDHQVLHGLRVLRRAEGRWHPDGAPDFAYVELELVELSH